MSRHLKLIAAVAVVLVAISGFSPARKGGGRSSGGGCSSSSSSSHSSSDSSYDSSSSSGGGSSSGGSSYRRDSGSYRSTTGTTGSNNGDSRNGTATGTVVRCAAQSGSEAKAVVRVRNPKSHGRTYRVKVEFVDQSGTFVDSGLADVRVGSRSSESVDVRMKHPERMDDVDRCLVESVK